MSPADRLRQLAERLPPGGSVMLTRDGLLELAVDSGPSDPARPRADLSIADVALHFRRAPSTIRDWCERDRFEGAYKLNGRDWRIPEAALETFLAKQRNTSERSQLGAWRGARKAGLTRPR
jgi:hypothetical protein